MDIDLPFDDSGGDLEHSRRVASDADDNESQDSVSFERHLTSSVEPELTGQQKPPKIHDPSEHRWRSLQDFYHDSYAELLRNEVAEGSNDGVSPVNLQQSQVGVVTWYPSEKIALYQALSKGRKRDIPFLANAIGSKSQLEVADYLSLLRQKLSERFQFHRHHVTISHADIPAATEISSEVEVLLEQAANAQLAYEGLFEYLSGAQGKEGLWIVDRELAEKLDAEHDEAEAKLSGKDVIEDKKTFDTPIFRISNFLELSERLFMNAGEASPWENWKNVALEGESPAMTQEVISELYDLTVHFTRKVMQTSIFMAQSRQRATTSSHYTHRSMVKEQDVVAALDVLNIKSDLWNFWIGVPRRNKLRIVDDRHGRKGHSSTRPLKYNAVECILSKKKVRWRGRRRSRSSEIDTSMTEDEAFDIADEMEAQEGSDSDPASTQYSSSSSDDDVPDHPEAHPLDAILDSPLSKSTDFDPSNDDDSGGSSYGDMSTDSDSISLQALTPRQKRRLEDLDRLQDEYLEKIDGEASRKEGAALLEMLGREVPVLMKPEYPEHLEEAGHLKIPRQAIEDLKDPLEAISYGAEWELFGGTVPNDSFVAIERARKKPKILPGPRTTEPLPRFKGKARQLPVRSRRSSAHSQS